MTELDFVFLRGLLRERSGLALGPEKRYLAELRLAPVCRAWRIASLSALVGRLRRGPEPGLAEAVVEAMATHETLFFRDRTTFEAIRTTILPGLVAARQARRQLRIWSAAASTGQEAYSLAMILSDLGGALAGWTVSVLATDMSSEAIGRGRTGTFSQFEVQRGLPIRALLAHFSQGPDGWTASKTLREVIDFRVHNLLDSFETLGRFDLVLCRNLLIYLDQAGKADLLARLAATLAPGGVLCLGSAETARGVPGLLPDPGLHGFYRRDDATTRHLPHRVASA